MTPDFVVDIMQQTVFLIVAIVSVMVVPALIIGLIVAIIQAATQVNEPTVSFFPRLVITLFMLAFMFPWIIKHLMEFANYIFIQAPRVIGIG